MDIKKSIEELDLLYENRRYTEVENFLLLKIKKSKEENDRRSEITFLNELMGFYRTSSRYKELIDLCEYIISLMKEIGLEGTVSYATTILNVATAYREVGRVDESLEYYSEVLKIYNAALPEYDMRFASIFNNMSIAYNEKKNYEKSYELLEKALSIVVKNKGTEIEEAITNSNMAKCLMKLNKLPSALNHIEKSLTIFEKKSGLKDFHYSASLSAMGELQFMQGNYENALKYFNNALIEIQSTIGKNSYYAITCMNISSVYDKLNNIEQKEKYKIMADEIYAKQNSEQKIKGIDLYQKYYTEYGAPMIEEKFPDYAERIAVGIVGSGSECFGFDDLISTDHDFGPSFCMWLTDEDYEEIGQELLNEYKKLPGNFMGYKRIVSSHGEGRVGVFRISDFYRKYTNKKDANLTISEWLNIPEHFLSEVTNGKIFKDDLGEFSKVRAQLLNYYPEEVRIKKIAAMVGAMAQSGQYNYSRSMRRKDIVAARLSLDEFIKSTISMVYLLNKRYQPYYKWAFRGMDNFNILPDTRKMIEDLSVLPLELNVWKEKDDLWKYKLNTNDRAVVFIEEICSLIVKELIKQGLTEHTNSFLENHTSYILSKIKNDKIRANVTSGNRSDVINNSIEVMSSLIEEIIYLEWDEFQKVNNEGGRALCQDNLNSFKIHRKSQFLAWNEELLKSYHRDLLNAIKIGRNLLTEKYARMMKSTAPENYESIKNILPEIPEDKEKLINDICKITIKWAEEYAKQYPKLSRNGRYIHSYEDGPYNTSIETYARGELSTYSEETLNLYYQHVKHLLSQSKNLSKIIMENTSKEYGYSSIDEAENKLGQIK